MNTAQKILTIMGIGYIGIGGLVSIVMLSVGAAGAFALIPFFFVLLGAGFIGGVYISNANKKRISKLGRKYSAKIYGYVENTSYMVNGCYPINTKVHYFDENGIEREAILTTSFARGSNQYPIGMTIDIFEYNGKYDFDAKSVRNEVLPREIELMDDKPVEPDRLSLASVSCPSCGATYQAARGYSNKCPYCGNFHNI